MGLNVTLTAHINPKQLQYLLAIFSDGVVAENCK